MNATRVRDRVTLGVLGVNNGPGAWPDGVNSEQEPDLLGVRCCGDPEEVGFLGGVLGTMRGASWRYDCGGDDGMGPTVSDANTGREGNGGGGRGALGTTLDGGCTVRNFASFATASSSSSEDSLEGCSVPWSCLRFDFAASRRLDDACAFLASRSARWRASASSDSRGSIAVLVRAHAGMTKFLRGFFSGAAVEVDVHADAHASVVVEDKARLETAALGTKVGWQVEVGSEDSDLKRGRGGDDRACLVGTSLADCD